MHYALSSYMYSKIGQLTRHNFITVQQQSGIDQLCIIKSTIIVNQKQEGWGTQ